MYNRLKELRINSAYSQMQLAQHLNISQPAYSKYEKGETEPNCETLIKLSRLYNVSIDYIVLGSTTNENTIDADILNLVQRLSLEEKKYILSCTRQLVNIKESNIIKQ